MPGYLTANTVSVTGATTTLIVPVGGSGLDRHSARLAFSNVALRLLRARHRHHQCHRRLTYATAIPAKGFNLALLGGNVLTLSGTNLYTGSTTITAGTLTVGTTKALPTTKAVRLGRRQRGIEP